MRKTHSYFLFVLLILIITPTISFAQNNSTNSPYTRYGYGRLAENAFGSQRAMGGIGIGLRNPQMINVLNPASFSAVDSMTFMLDFGVMGQMAWYKDDYNKARKANANIEYLAMQFPLSKQVGMGIGIEPVSYVGYSYGSADSLDYSTDISYRQYYGSGGTNKVYASLSYNFLDRLSIGANVGYLFGDIYNNVLSTFDNTSIFSTLWADTLRTSGVVYEAGLQYQHPIGKDKNLVIGAVYSPKTKFKGTIRRGELTQASSSSTPESSTSYVTRDSIFEMPETIGFGLSFNRNNHYTIGADVQFQRWADVRFYNKTDSLSNSLKINLGGEFVPNYQSSNIFKRIRYRAGAYYTNSYVNVAGKGYDEYGATLGFGFPTGDRRSYLNLAFDYTAVRPEVKGVGLVNEQYFKVTVSYTFNESWFFKRKIQ